MDVRWRDIEQHGQPIARRLFCPFRNLTLLRRIELAQHIVECTGKTPDLVFARIVDTMAVVSCLAYPLCQTFKAPERSHDMAVGGGCGEETDCGQRPRQPQDAGETVIHGVDAALEQRP